MFSFFNKNRILYIREEWAKRKGGKRNFKNIRNLYDKLKDKGFSEFYIDDQTWEDLNMNEVYSQLDRTSSLSGKHVLYNILRTPFLKKGDLEKRDELIEYFREHTEEREKILLELNKLDTRDTGVIDLLFDKLQKNKNLQIIFNILALIPLVAIIGIIVYGIKSKFTTYLMGSLILNGIIHYKSEVKFNYRINAMSTIGKMMRITKNIGKLNVDIINEYTRKLSENSIKCKRIYNNTSNINRMDGIDIVGDYLALIFLVKERAYLSLIDYINQNQKELLEIYMILGELDALISIASFKEEMGEKLTKPILTEGKRYIYTKNIVHPVIEKPVPNTIKMNNKGIILTGSNMSGKSTFLRTLGVNALLAQTIYSCAAEYYEASYFKIITSISPEDNLISGKSYYFGEVESLLRIVKSVDKDIPILSLIDEIFRGTNPIERVSAAAEILGYLNKNNTLVAVATHDLELTKILDEEYNCYYFREEIQDDRLKFDYLIKEGVSPTRNAIRILKLVGYPKEIVDNAEKRIISCD